MNAIEIKNVYKSFKIYFDKGATLKEKILFKNRNKHEIHEVLKDISFNIKKGEVVGLIGENGCGKSTLLKLMTRIIYPDQGTINVNGKVSSLIELGAGFHADMTGRENIYTNASIFGLSKKQIDKRIQDIINFSELGEFIDNPVRTYSSGMYMRLAFSVAINVDADILLIDEILAVGDAAFQAKCFNKLQEIKKSGTTIVIVSHDSTSIERLCSRAIWIDKGIKRIDDNPHHALAVYLDSVMNHTKDADEYKNKEKDQSKESTIVQHDNRTGNGDLQITEVIMLDETLDRENYSFKTGQKIRIQVKYKQHNPEVDTSVLGVGIFRVDGIQCYGTNTFIDGIGKIPIKKNGILEVEIEELQLLEGKYLLDIALHDETGTPYDYIRGVKAFYVYSNIRDVGIFRLKHTFKIE